jgi:site-specific DNA-methyltransferase (adenine-specific)
MFSSNKQDWQTPDSLFDDLDNEFGFSIDVASSDENCKCENHFTMENSGLDKQWIGTCFMNPPYNEMYDWIRKAYTESQHGATVVALIPARTDTRYFHDFCMKAEELRFIRGRLKFSNCDNSAPFPSVLVVFNQDNNGTPLVTTYAPSNEKHNRSGIYTVDRCPIGII